MITGTIWCESDDGYCYTWHGQVVPRETVSKPMSYGLRLYMLVMYDLVRDGEVELFKRKLNACRRTFGSKGPEYANILNHFETMEEWINDNASHP